MFHRFIPALAAVLVFACAPADQAEARQSSDLSRTEIEEIVRTYLVQNPEVIEEALIELQRRRRDAEQMAQVNAVEAYREAIYEDPRTPVVGSQEPLVTVVEFVDYRCSFCTISNEWVQRTLDEHASEVRFIFKEFPLRGPESLESARAALAVWKLQPETYAGFHNALINASGPLPSERINALAQLSGVDVDAMREAMGDEAISIHLEEVRALGRDIGVRGTPFFIVGGEIIPGADLEALESALNAALAAAQG